VSVDSTLPNRLAAGLLTEGKVRGVRAGWKIRREVIRGRSRFDFLALSPDGCETLIEVKSVTLVENGCARFPDAPTARGRRHVRELAEIVRNGGRAMVLFIVQRDDARSITPNRETDPEFAEALAAARSAGVILRGAKFRLDGHGRAAWLGPLPVRLR
jgi:sugar fermentation stimulation protein A